MNKRILLTGGDGYIASSIYNSLCYRYNIVKTNRMFDLSKPYDVEKLFLQRFDAVIHTATRGGSRLKKDDHLIIDNNLKVYYNLLEYRHMFDKFINFGSGMELTNSLAPYGISKRVIRDSILEKDNFYNLRIFSVWRKWMRD